MMVSAHADLQRRFGALLSPWAGSAVTSPFRFGRKRLLRQFLRRRAIFLTDHFHQRLEQQARINLQWAIDQL